MERKFYVTGYAPVVDNVLMKVFGFENNVYVKFVHTVTATLVNDVTEEQLQKQLGAIKKGYVESGCIEVMIAYKENNQWKIGDK